MKSMFSIPRLIQQIVCFFLLILFTACPNNYDFEYDIIITDNPVNLMDLNTQYDDFNSDLPYDYDRTDIYFSSNRYSGGANFDIVAKGLDFSYHDKDGVLNLTISDEPIFERQATRLLDSVNTGNNELGPFSSNYFNRDLLFLYANDVNDTFKIKMIEYTYWNASSQETVISAPTELPVINDSGNNLYPSFNLGSSTMYFCSDREASVFNIYSAYYNGEIVKDKLLKGDVQSIQKETALSSKYDDKCPFILDDVMVFTSNRAGGAGGYDLYYSFFENGSWTSPQPFGNNINTQYDEYRPIIFYMLGYHLMIFSSNRSGGKGGYDLYIVKIDDFIN